MLNEINAGLEAVKAFYNGYKWMEDFGQRMSGSFYQKRNAYLPTKTFRHEARDAKSTAGFSARATIKK